MVIHSCLSGAFSPTALDGADGGVRMVWAPRHPVLTPTQREH